MEQLSHINEGESEDELGVSGEDAGRAATGSPSAPSEDGPSPSHPSREYKYHITRVECVMCGNSDEYRERIYGAKETKRTYRQYACPEHFL